jgi:hypothetical protein
MIVFGSAVDDPDHAHDPDHAIEGEGGAIWELVEDWKKRIWSSTTSASRLSGFLRSWRRGTSPRMAVTPPSGAGARHREPRRPARGETA